MKIPKNTIIKMLEDSESFREFAASQLLKEVSKNLREQVENLVIDSGDNLLVTIKNLRGFSITQANEIVDAFPNLHLCRNYSSRDYLTLSDAKTIVQTINATLAKR